MFLSWDICVWTRGNIVLQTLLDYLNAETRPYFLKIIIFFVSATASCDKMKLYAFCLLVVLLQGQTNPST